jgi:hypothetical protein
MAQKRRRKGNKTAKKVDYLGILLGLMSPFSMSQIL